MHANNTRFESPALLTGAVTLLVALAAQSHGGEGGSGGAGAASAALAVSGGRGETLLEALNQGELVIRCAAVSPTGKRP